MDLKNETIEKILLEESKKEQNRLKINLKHIESGVKFLDWKNAYIDDSVVIGEGTFIGPGVVIKGNTVIGKTALSIRILGLRIAKLQMMSAYSFLS